MKGWIILIIRRPRAVRGEKQKNIILKEEYLSTIYANTIFKNQQHIENGVKWLSNYVSVQ
jgi:hypothetical protein